MRLTVNRGAVRLTVEDDGVGLSPEASSGPATTSGGFGLRSMRERAAALGGSAVVRGSPGAGTTVEVVLPPASRDSEGK